MLSINNLCKAYVGANLFKNFSLEMVNKILLFPIPCDYLKVLVMFQNFFLFEFTDLGESI